MKKTFQRRDLIADLYNWDYDTRKKIKGDPDEFIFTLKNNGKLGSFQSIQRFAREIQCALSNLDFGELTGLWDDLDKLLVKKIC